MRIMLSTLACRELDDACAYYETQFPGLGDIFRKAVEKTTRRIAAHPEAWSVETGEIRKCLVHRFPYKLLYSLEDDHIFIIAVAHQHRRPGYWIDHMDND
ncbi:type II toxin-antitoxin system RelE/ParE family toxin [Thiolapillus sp.]